MYQGLYRNIYTLFLSYLLCFGELCCQCCTLLQFPLQCAKSVIQNKVIANDKDLMGVVFFGTVRLFQLLLNEIALRLFEWNCVLSDE